MPLENRVDPFGAIHARSDRGLFTGNRGVIHDPATKTLLSKRWTNPAWIICTLDMPDRPNRDVMGYNGRQGGAGWTELFFLDEVTALAAGHRPCFYCRREAANAFLRCHADATGVAKPKAPDLDRRLHAERLPSRRSPPQAVAGADIALLPDGTMVARKGRAFAKKGAVLREWRFEGYGASLPVGQIEGDGWTLVTPATTIAVLRAGFQPIWHLSA